MKKSFVILLFLSIFFSATVCMENDEFLMPNSEIYAQAHDQNAVKVTAAGDDEFYVKKEVAQVLYRVSHTIRHLVDDIIEVSNAIGIYLPGMITQQDFIKFYDYLKLIDEELNDELQKKLSNLPCNDLASFLMFANVLNVKNLSDIKESFLRIIKDKYFLEKQKIEIEDPYLNKELISCILNPYPKIIPGILVKVKIPSTILKHTDLVISAEFNESGNKVVTASFDKTARIWDVASGQCLQVLKGHTKRVRSAEFNPSGNKVITASGDKTARIWDVATGKCLKVLKGHTGSVNSAEFNVSGDKVVTASKDRTARIWDVASGQCLQVLKGHTDHIHSAIFNRPGDKVVTASVDKTARIWDVESGQCLKVLKGHTSRVNSAEFNPSGNKVVTASGDFDCTARVWDIASGQCLKVLKGHTEWLNSAKFDVSGNKIVTASGDKKTRIWDISEFLEIEKYLQKELTLEQALFLVKLYEREMQLKENQQSSIFNSLTKPFVEIYENYIIEKQIKEDQKLSEIFNSFDKRVQDILVANKFRI